MNTNQNTGAKGEELATAYLISKKYIIIERNWRYKQLEVDIIASLGNRLHFFEIKTRTSHAYGKPEESISTQKMNNLKNAAEEYQYLHPEWKYVQFDAVAITLLYNQPPDFYLIEDIYF